MLRKKRAIVVGSGISGATIANILAENNYKVTLYDAQLELGGTCADRLTRTQYFQLHGSHIFHTNDKEVWDYLSKFTTWINYQHKVKTLIHGKLYALPLNKEFYEDYLAQYTLKQYKESKELSFDDLQKINEKLCDIVFSKAFNDYSLKQWSKVPSLSVLNRVKALRTTDEDRYFLDTYQGIPTFGFSKMIGAMLYSKPSIKVIFGTFDFAALQEAKAKNIPVFFTGSIDCLLEYKFGHLPYRTCTFITETVEKIKPQAAAVINYPSLLYNFTRSHDYSWYIPTKNATMAYEYPINFDDKEHSLVCRYYPINETENLELYEKYVAYTKEAFSNLILAGRQGLYKYMNIDQAVRSSLDIVYNFIKNNK